MLKGFKRNARSLVYSTVGVMCFSAPVLADMVCNLPVDSLPIGESGVPSEAGIYGGDWGRDSVSAPGTLLGCSHIAAVDLWNSTDTPEPFVEHVERAYLLRFLTTDAAGRSVPATGMLLVPKASSVPSSHQGKSPLVAVASGTVGVNDQCAPSKLMRLGAVGGVDSRANLYLQKGMTVMVIDYIGLGTVLGENYDVNGKDPSDDSPYMEAESTAHVVLDGIRAARQVPGAHYAVSAESVDTIPLDWPVAITGFSQGGGASLLATLFAPSYAPELPLRASIAGAAPVDLKETILQIDDSIFRALHAIMLIGAKNATHPSTLSFDLDEHLSPDGEALVALARDNCVDSLGDSTLWNALWGAYELEDLLAAPVADLFADPDFQLWLSRNSITENGTTLWAAPTSPTLAFHGMSDGVVPHDAAEALFDQWGATDGTIAWSGDVNFPRVDLGWQSAPLASHMTGSSVETNTSDSWLRYTAFEWMWDGLFSAPRQTPDLAQ